MHAERDPPPASTAAPSAPRTPVVGHAFELWLQQRLHQLYDDVMREPIPPELLRLIQDDLQRRQE